MTALLLNENVSSCTMKELTAGDSLLITISVWRATSSSSSSTEHWRTQLELGECILVMTSPLLQHWPGCKLQLLDKEILLPDWYLSYENFIDKVLMETVKE